MKNNKNLLKIGWLLIGAGVILLIYGFFHMYNLPGDCLDNQNCGAVATWHNENTIGLLVLIAGIAAALFGFSRKK